MTATNHALTGALIGLTIHQPILAIPIAFISHYLMDAIPHFSGFSIRAKSFRLYLVIEAFLCFTLVLFLIFRQPNYWWLGAICAFTAASPDFMWVRDFLAQQKGRRGISPKYWWAKLHAHVQWFQKPIGAIVEIAWAAAAISILAIIIKK